MPPPPPQSIQQSETQYIYDPNVILPTSQHGFALPSQAFPQEPPTSTFIREIASWNDDLQVGLVAAALYILITMTPIESVIYRYIALDKLPYSGVVIKATMMFVLMILFVKFVK